MTSGILRSWYLAKISKAQNPVEYFYAMQEFVLYEIGVYSFNLRKYF